MTAIHADALALAARGAKDSVSNVRYVAAKVLGAASKVVTPALIESDIKCVASRCVLAQRHQPYSDPPPPPYASGPH